MALVAGCVSRTNVTTVAQPSDLDGRHRPASATTRPILYERTGGIAGTDDRVVIWPDGVVEVTGRVIPSGTSRLAPQRHERLMTMFKGWNRLNDAYVDTTVADAYTITIHYGDKSVTASDIAPTLPEQFRTIFVEIEAIAGQVSAGPALPTSPPSSPSPEP